MNRLLFPVVVAMIAAALVGGFMAVGGPGFARMERHDQTRASDLRTLLNYYRCDPAIYPEGAAIPARCAARRPKPDVADPVTGAPYERDLLEGGGFDICANFQTRVAGHSQDASMLLFEGQRGCLRFVPGATRSDVAPLSPFEVRQLSASDAQQLR